MAVNDPPFPVLPAEDVGGAQGVRRPLTSRGVDGLVLEGDGVGEVAARPGRDQLLLLVHQPGHFAGLAPLVLALCLPPENLRQLARTAPFLVFEVAWVVLAAWVVFRAHMWGES